MAWKLRHPTIVSDELRMNTYGEQVIFRKGEGICHTADAKNYLLKKGFILIEEITENANSSSGADS